MGLYGNKLFTSISKTLYNNSYIMGYGNIYIYIIEKISN